ncbi:MAG: carboxypeptidase regulatory-like domain-containing protein [Candidatus Brocadiae bacterium]|nr:carboxypeptidase regulatory-like domain-containing protein [Candidatus Brocadiia bacterium]
MNRISARTGIALLVAALCAGCTASSPSNGGTSRTASGTLRVDVRRDGNKRAIKYSYVVYSIGRDPGDVNFRVVAEPSAAMPPEGIPPEQWGPINEQTWDLPPGRYGVDIFATEASFRSRDLIVREGETTVFRADLTPGGSIAGLVVGPSGDPMPGVLVFRPLDRGYGQSNENWNPKQSTEASRVVRTGSSGKYYLPFLPPGEHLIIYYNEVLGWTEKTVTVVDGKRLELRPVMVGDR